MTWHGLVRGSRCGFDADRLRIEIHAFFNGTSGFVSRSVKSLPIVRQLARVAWVDKGQARRDKEKNSGADQAGVKAARPLANESHSKRSSKTAEVGTNAVTNAMPAAAEEPVRNSPGNEKKMGKKL